MATNCSTCKPCANDPSNEATWRSIYPKLYALSRQFVIQYRLPCWSGQEEDIAADVTQETVRRLIEYADKAARGEAAPIRSLEHLMVVAARHTVCDLRRRDQRRMRLNTSFAVQDLRNEYLTSDVIDPSELATEEMYQEQLFRLIAGAIAQFPCKLRQALLVDLANRTNFETEPTALQRAFSEVGIDLHAYQLSLPKDPRERSRHTSLVWHAYKRLDQVIPHL